MLSKSLIQFSSLYSYFTWCFSQWLQRSGVRKAEFSDVLIVSVLVRHCELVFSSLPIPPSNLTLG